MGAEENAVKKLIYEYLHLQPGVYVWRRNSGRIRGKYNAAGRNGMADLWGIIAPEGRHFEVEVKTPTGKLSSVQVEWGAIVNATGGIWVSAYSLESFIEAWAKARGVSNSDSKNE